MRNVGSPYHTLRPEHPPQGLQAWPPWPITRRHTITYCYEDQPTADALTRLFEAGLAKWAPAFRVSNVEFITDPNCFQLPCLCRVPPAAPPAAGRPGRRSVAANATQTAEPWLKVEFCDGFTTTVGPVPTEAPISPDSPRALELAKEYDADMQGTHFTEDVLI